MNHRKRFEILRRDDFRCRYCGQRSPAVVLHVDHIKPRADGGSDDDDNLTTACSACNLGKSDVSLEPTRSELLNAHARFAWDWIVHFHHAASIDLVPSWDLVQQAMSEKGIDFPDRVFCYVFDKHERAADAGSAPAESPEEAFARLVRGPIPEDFYEREA